MASSLPKLTISPAQIRDDYLRTIKNGLFDRGYEDVNISPGSDWWVQAEAVAGLLTVFYNNIVVTADAVMPDTSSDEDLDRWLGIVGLSRRSAAGSTGAIIFSTDFATLVPTGAELTSNNGLRIKVSQGGTYEDGDIIPVEAMDVGAQTNLAGGETLSWASPPFGAGPTATLSDAGMTGGVDAEVDDVARARLFDRLANPPAAGNWSWIAQMCERIDSAVQKAFVYNAHNGPSTVALALVGNPAEGSTKSRAIDSIKLNSTIIPNILGSMPEYAETTITTVEDVGTDISFQITLPTATNTSSALTGPGSGTGWLDPTPWPTPNGSTHFFCDVVAVTDSQHFTVRAPLAPSVGISRVCWIDRTTWTVKRAKVSALNSSGSGTYGITIDLPFVGIAVGDWLFPASVFVQKYLDAVLTAFRLMGPGERVDVSAFPIGARRPRQTERWPSNIDSSMLRYVINAGDEVQTAEYWYRSTQMPAVIDDGSTDVVIPNTPSSPTSPPKILVPRQIGFYPPYPLR